MSDRVYLDHAATTPVRADVLEAMLPHFTELGFNPSSLHAEGRSARRALDDARGVVAKALGAKPREVVFTGSGSEADNLAIAGAAQPLRNRGKHVVSSVIEHHAVLHALDALRDEGWDVTLLRVDSGGRVQPHAFEEALRDDTVLATIAYANNEIGTVQPIADLAGLARRRGVLFHTDAVQAPLYLPLDVRALGVDLLSIAAHKFYGPKGVGALYVREGTALAPIVHGGSQEFAKRAGTENVAGIVGMARALELALAEQRETAARVRGLRDRLEGAIVRSIGGVRIHGGGDRLPNFTSASFLEVDSDRLLVLLDLEGIAVSAGSACGSGAIEPSHVIGALGLETEWTRGVIRFTLGRETTQSGIDRTVRVLERSVAQLRALRLAST